jgi:hypothetical protein
MPDQKAWMGTEAPRGVPAAMEHKTTIPLHTALAGSRRQTSTCTYTTALGS